MADQTIVYTEEMVGSGHPTKTDTLNRLALVDHGTDGQHTLAGFQGSQFAADAEASDTYVITLDPVPAAYFTGMVVVFTANTANTGACTLNVNSLGAKSIKKKHDQDPADGEIEAGAAVMVVYDGTNFQMLSQSAIPTELSEDPSPQLAATLDGQDNTVQKVNLLDIGTVTNAIGSIGGGAQTIDLELGNSVVATVDTSETTFTFSNPTASDEECGFTLYLTNGGSQTVNWPASVDWAGGTAPSLTASGVDVLVFTTVDGGTIWNGFAAAMDIK